ncbi:hypothetical protein H0H81_000277, partial [Sphagnurus paluster]
SLHPQFDAIKAPYWRNNVLLSPADHRTIKLYMDQENSDIAQINKRIQAFQIEIEVLLAKIDTELVDRARKESKVFEYKAILSPVRLLPPEILKRIFEYSLPREQKLCRRHLTSTICLVSAAWRNAALGSPNLWIKAFEDFPVPKRISAGRRSFFELTQTKSGERSLWFSSLTCSAVTNQTFPATIFRTFKPYFSTFVELHLTGFYDLGTFFSLPRDSIPTLKKLDIQYPDYRAFRAGDSQEMTVFQGATSLCDLTLNLPEIAFEAWKFNESFPWGQICYLDIKEISFSLFSQIMNSGTALEKASFIISAKGSSSTPRPIGTLPNLSLLSIVILLGFYNPTQYMLSSLHLPTLKMLHVKPKYPENYPRQIDIEALLHPTTSFLSSILDISYIRVDDIGSFSTLISACTAVETMHLHPSNPFLEPPDRIFEELNSLCAAKSPRLINLTLIFHSIVPDVLQAMLAQFTHLAKRWGSIERPEHVRHHIRMHLLTRSISTEDPINDGFLSERAKFQGIFGSNAIGVFHSTSHSSASQNSTGSPVYVGIWYDFISMDKIYDQCRIEGRPYSIQY